MKNQVISLLLLAIVTASFPWRGNADEPDSSISSVRLSPPAQGSGSTASAGSAAAISSPAAGANTAVSGADEPDRIRRAEIEFVASALTPEGRKLVERRLGALSSLPLYKVELSYTPRSRLLQGNEQILLPLKNSSDKSAKQIFFRVPAASERGANLELGVSTVDGRDIKLVRHSASVFSLTLPEAAPSVPSAPNEDKVRNSPDEAAPAHREIALSFSLKLGKIHREHLAEAQALSQLMPTALGNRDDASTNSEHGNDTEEHQREHILFGVFPELAVPGNGGFVRSSDPSVGEPIWNSQPANYIVALILPGDFSDAGTGVKIGMVPEADGRVRSTRVAAAVRGFALAVGRDWEKITMEAEKIHLSAYYPKNYDRAAQERLNSAAKVLAFFSDKFSAYPWTTFEIALTESSAGSDEGYPCAAFMEAGLQTNDVNYASRAFMQDLESKIRHRQEEEIAHMAAHQWFRGIVGSDGLGDPAADEAPAIQAVCLYSEEKYGKATGDLCRKERFSDTYRMFRTSYGRDMPLSSGLDDFPADEYFEAISGAKGAFMLEALRSKIGRSAYIAAMKHHVAQTAFGSSSLENFVTSACSRLSASKRTSVRAMARRFFKEKQGDQDIGGPFTPADFLKRLQGIPGLEALIQGAMAGPSAAQDSSGKDSRPNQKNPAKTSSPNSPGPKKKDKTK